jgi:hypothetical protein
MELGVAPEAVLSRLKSEGLGELVPDNMTAMSLGMAECLREWFSCDLDLAAVTEEVHDIDGAEILDNRIRRLGREVIERIVEINEKCINSGQLETFARTSEDSRIDLSLWQPAHDRVTFERFASALYKLLFERTRLVVPSRREGGKPQSKTLGRLPSTLRYTEPILVCASTLRNYYGGHLTGHPDFIVIPGQVDVKDVHRQYLGAPVVGNGQYRDLQAGLLQDVKTYLDKLFLKL